MQWRLLLPATLALAAAALILEPQDFSQVEIAVHPVGGSVSYLEGQGGNIGVCVGADGVLMIDDQYAPLAPKIEAAVKSLSDSPVRYLINTHWHGDHVGGNPYFGKTATLLAHENVRRRLAGDRSIGGRTEQSPQAAALPVLTWREGVTLHFNGEEIRVIHFPTSHTDGDSIVWFVDSNVVHLGDLYFQSGFPFVDVDSGGNARGLVTSIGRILELIPADAEVISGHGEATGVEGLEVYLEMLEDCITQVEEALEEDLSAEQMVQDGLLEEHEERWGGGFMSRERFLSILVRSLSQDD